MRSFQIGDIVARKSYGGDIPFKIANVVNDDYGKKLYVLRGVMVRLEADSTGDDLVVQNPAYVYSSVRMNTALVQRQLLDRGFTRNIPGADRARTRPGRILHIDSSQEFMDKCIEMYKGRGLEWFGVLAAESEQPQVVRGLIERYSPDIVVITGHDSIKKGSYNQQSFDSYRNSRYFAQAAAEARRIEPSYDKLCIFAGACQSYFEALMSAGANFASSPKRVLIHSLDPAIVSSKVALTETNTLVTPEEVASLATSGSDGIGGINTRGQMTLE